MKAFIFVLVAIFVGLGALAYFVWPFSGDQPAAEPVRSVVGEATFNCPNGPTIETIFYSNDSMVMNIDGVTHELQIATSASGARYQNEAEGLEFWEHQGEATVTMGGRTYTACVSGEALYPYTTMEIVDGRALSFVPPPGTDVSVENETFYKILFAGPTNEPPALTDGYTVTLTLLDKATTTDLAAFVEAERDLIEPPIEAPLSPVVINGHQGYSFTYETALGTEATSFFWQLREDSVARATVSAVGDNAGGYQPDIDNILESVTLVETNTD